MKNCIFGLAFNVNVRNELREFRKRSLPIWTYRYDKVT